MIYDKLKFVIWPRRVVKLVHDEHTGLIGRLENVRWAFFERVAVVHNFWLGDIYFDWDGT